MKKPVSAATRALMDEMSRDTSQVASESTLETIRDRIRKLRELEFQNVSLAETMERNSAIIRQIKDKELVDMFDSARINVLGVQADGNLPPYEIEIRPYYKANIAADWEPEKKAAAYAWLDKHKLGDMLRNTFSIQLGKGTRDKQKKLAAFLKKSKIEFSYVYGVPHTTLTAFVKEQYEAGKTLPLELLGATVGRVATVKKEKKGK